MDIENKCTECGGSGSYFKSHNSADGTACHSMVVCHCYNPAIHGELPKPIPTPKEEMKCDGEDGCGNWYHEDEWIDTETGCELCGSHNAYQCPNKDCEEIYDSVYDDRETRKAK